MPGDQVSKTSPAPIVFAASTGKIRRSDLLCAAERGLCQRPYCGLDRCSDECLVGHLFG